MLAFLPEEERNAILRHHEFKRFTKETITTREVFGQEMEKIRVTGYALDRGEDIEGINCAAAPVLDLRKYPVAALTVTGPSFRMPLSDLPRIGKLVQEHANQIAIKFCGSTFFDN